MAVYKAFDWLLVLLGSGEISDRGSFLSTQLQGQAVFMVGVSASNPVDLLNETCIMRIWVCQVNSTELELDNFLAICS